MRFILTIDTPEVDRPGIGIANTMRLAADVVEKQVPLEAEGIMRDRLSGETTCEWTFAEPEPPPEPEA